jgi:hypothetical protein
MAWLRRADNFEDTKAVLPELSPEAHENTLFELTLRRGFVCQKKYASAEN